MGRYILNVDPSGRAGCKGSACKKEGLKIPKGVVRFGSIADGLGDYDMTCTIHPTTTNHSLSFVLYPATLTPLHPPAH